MKAKNTKAKKTHPFTRKQLEAIAVNCPTPFHIYDEAAIRAGAKRLNAALAWMPGFKNYYAVKACPNPYILKMLAEEGFGTDCSSLPELVLSEKAGIVGEDIMFTSNDTPPEEFVKCRELGGVVNLDDISHLPFLDDVCGVPELICFRYNPGPRRMGGGTSNFVMGHPEEAKYGLTHEQTFEAYSEARRRGAKRFGIHTFVASNELNPQYFVETARMLFDVARELKERCDIRLEFVNISGGVGVAYRPEDKPVDLEIVGEGLRRAYEELIVPAGLAPVKIFMECGRVITGPYGYLVTRVRHIKHIYRDIVGTDACSANLMRPMMYGAYHHISVVGKEDQPHDQVYDVAGSLCESTDRFAEQRPLPAVDRDDLLIIHDAGAHGHSMGYNYNGKLRSAELMLKPDGSVEQIRRAETMDDLFATLDFAGL